MLENLNSGYVFLSKHYLSQQFKLPKVQLSKHKKEAFPQKCPLGRYFDWAVVGTAPRSFVTLSAYFPEVMPSALMSLSPSRVKRIPQVSPLASVR